MARVLIVYHCSSHECPYHQQEDVTPKYTTGYCVHPDINEDEHEFTLKKDGSFPYFCPLPKRTDE